MEEVDGAMKYFALILLIMFSCTPEAVFLGIPDDHHCSEFQDRMAVCVSSEQEYTCVADRTGGCGYKPAGEVHCVKSQGNAKAAIRQRKREQDKDNDNTDMLLLMQMNNSTTY